MRCCHINLSVLSSIVHFPIPGDDCCAFAAMASWCVVYGLPLYMSHDTVRSFRRHMTYTLMRGNVHFLLPTRVCNTRFRFLPMSMHFTKIIFLFFYAWQRWYYIYQKNGMRSLARYNAATGEELQLDSKQESLKGSTSYRCCVESF